jgi:dynein heavy chain
MAKSSKWVLCIDPESQANKFIKKLNQPRKLKVLKPSQEGYMRII